MNRCFPNALALVGLLVVGGCVDNIFGETWTEITTFKSARVSLRQAVQKAEATGGRATSLKFEASDDIWPDGRYDVTLMNNGQSRIVSVDLLSGRVGPEQKDEGVKALLKGDVLDETLEQEDIAKGHEALEAGLNLHDAVMTAERNGGKAMEAKAVIKGSVIGYDVEIVDDHGAHKVFVDSKNS